MARRRVRALLAATAMATVLTPVATSAQEAVVQESQCVADPAGDVRDGDTRVEFPPGDTIDACYLHRPDGLLISLGTAQPLDPATDPLWADGAIIMELYSVRPGGGAGEGAEGRPVQVVYYARDGQIQVFTRPIVHSGADDFTCFGTATFEGQRYTALIPWECIPTEDHVTIETLWLVFTPEDHNYIDAAPSMCCVPPPPPAEDPEPPAPAAPPATPGALTHGARLDGGGAADPIGQAIVTSQHLFGDGAAERVVLATADRFPDALAGAPLAGTRGPILFTSGTGALDPRVGQEIQRVTGGDGTVLVLGGLAAVSEEAASQARAAAGDRPCAVPLPESCRFAGGGREETAALVAEAVIAEGATSASAPEGGDPSEPTTVLVARADDFADALTGGAFAARTGTPVLLTPTTFAHPATVAFLDRHRPDRLVALGGTAAISDAALASLPAARRDRVFGPERTATAAAIAEQLWAPAGAGEGGVVLVNVRHPQGWQTALAAAVASAIHDAPQIGIESPPAGISDSAAAALASLPPPVQAFGDATLVSDRQIADATGPSGA